MSAQFLKGKVKKASLSEGDPEKNPYGTLDVTISCYATEGNILALQRLRGEHLIVLTEQMDLEANKVEGEEP